MSNKNFKTFVEGLRLEPLDLGPNPRTDAGLDLEGLVYVYENKLKAFLGSAIREFVTLDDTQVLTNKSIDADNNTIAELEVDNLKAGVLIVDTDLTGASDTTIGSALAIKTYIDNSIAAHDDASEVTYTPAVLTDWDSDTDPGNVDGGLDQLASRVKVDETNISTNATDITNIETKTDFISVTQAVDLDTIESGISTNATAISDHLADATDAHDSSAISYDNSTSGLTASEVQAAIDEVEARVETNETNIGSGSSDLTTHLNDATDAHAASAISFDNSTSGLTATETQAAIDEVEGRVDTAETNISTNSTDITNIETKTDFISVTQAVDLDTMESNISTNSTNLTNHEADTSTHGVGEIVGTTEVQTISNKSIQSPSRLDVKQDTEANLTTYATTATNGQLCFATDTKLMYQVVDGALAEVGGGVGGSDIFAVINFDDDKLSDWDTTNLSNASISEETTSPLKGKKSLKFTNAVGATGEYADAETYSVPLRSRGKTGLVRFQYKYSGTSEYVKLVYRDITNSNDLGEIYLKQEDNVTTGNLLANIPVSCTQVSLRLEFVTGETSTGYLDDIEFSDKPFGEAALVKQETITYTGYTSKDGSSYVKLKTEAVNTSNDLLEIDNTTYPNYTRYTFKKPCQFVATVSSRGSAAANGITIYMYDSSGTEIIDSRETVGGTGHYGSPSLTYKASTGDYLLMYASGTPTDTLSNNFSVTATAVADHVLVAGDEGTYWETVEKILPSDVNATGDIASLQFDNLIIGKEYELSGNLDIQQGGVSEYVELGSGALQSGTVYSRINTRIYTGDARKGVAVSFKFTAVSTSLYVYRLDGTYFMLGNGTTEQTFLQLKRTDPQVRTVALPASEQQTFSARIANNGTATITSVDSDWIESVTRISLGQVSIAYKTGVFSIAPTIVITNSSAGASDIRVEVHSETASGCIAYTSTLSGTTSDQNFNIVLKKQGADSKPPGVFVGNFRPKQLAYVKVHATDYINSLVSTTSYKTRQLLSLSGDNIGAFVSSNQLTLKKGVYDLTIPIGAYNGSTWVSLQIYRTSGTAGQIEEFINVSYSDTICTGFNTVKTTLTLLEDTAIEFRTKSGVASGNEFMSRISIERRQ